jgi:tetratricopeptide (TPR) repeat protein
MADLLYIENYFKGEFTSEETREFEKKIKDDPDFAGEVAFYCSAIQVIKDQSIEEKKTRFRKLYEESKQSTPVKSLGIRKIWPYIAAAAVITGVIFGIYIYNKPTSLQQVADQFIKKELQADMGVKMAGNTDSLDAAIQLYNDNKLQEALVQFERISRSGSNPEQSNKMAGIVSLRLKDYDKAIDYFTQLENLDLYSNPGKLLHALALIKRDRPGDKETAKQILTQVIEEDLEGKEYAKKWKELL